MTDELSEARRDLEAFAVEQAFVAAWYTQWWIPREPEYGFVDYVEAAAMRNLQILDDLAALDLDDQQTRHELNRIHAESAEQGALGEFV